MSKFKAFILNNYHYITWAIVLMAVSGSLYFSEILKLPPCFLCWYQRITMYPLLLIIGTGILRQDKNLPYYVLPLSILGLGVASFQLLLYHKIIPETAAPCVAGISCTTQFFSFLGFIDIPHLSWLAFLAVSVLMILAIKLRRTA